MANPTCDAVELIEEAACLQCLNPRYQQAAIAYLNMLELAALGGTDYMTDFPGAVEDAATQTYSRFTQAQRETALVAIALQNAINAGATVPADVNDWMPFIIPLENYPDLDAVSLALLCSLGRHADLPQ